MKSNTILKIASRFTALWLLATSVAHALDNRALVEQIYVQSGAEIQIDSLPAQIVKGLEEGRGQWDSQSRFEDDLFNELRTRVASGLNMQAMRATVTSKLAERLSIEQCEKILLWLSSPVGKRIVAHETKAADLDTMQLQSYMLSLRKAPPSPEYLEQIDSIIQVTGSLELTATAASVLQVAMVSAGLAAQPDVAPGALEQAIKKIEANRPLMVQQIGDQVRMIFMYTYRDAGLEDLQAYVDFLDGELGRYYSKSFADALLFGYRDFGYQVGEVLNDVIGQLLAQKES